MNCRCNYCMGLDHKKISERIAHREMLEDMSPDETVNDELDFDHGYHDGSLVDYPKEWRDYQVHQGFREYRDRQDKAAEEYFYNHITILLLRYPNKG